MIPYFPKKVNEKHKKGPTQQFGPFCSTFFNTFGGSSIQVLPCGMPC